jgi:hypothetical protein
MDRSTMEAYGERRGAFLNRMGSNEAGRQRETLVTDIRAKMQQRTSRTQLFVVRWSLM